VLALLGTVDPARSLALCETSLRKIVWSEAPNLIAVYHLRRSHASLRGIIGDHWASIDELNRLEPLARWVGICYPAYYCDFLNSVLLGNPVLTKQQTGLGVYGIGMKRAFFKMGRQVAVESHTRDEEFPPQV
jgi:hypothetical protein